MFWILQWMIVYWIILRLTETQYKAGSDTSIIESALHKKYTMHFNNRDNKFKSIAYALSNDSEILVKEDLMEFLILTFKNNIIVIVPFQLHLYICF